MTGFTTDRTFPQEAGAAKEFDLGWLWLAVAKRWRLILLSLLVTLVPTLLYIGFTKPIYRASTTIQLDPAVANVLPYKDISDPLGGFQHYELYIKTQDEILRSDMLWERTVQRVREESAGPKDERFDLDLSTRPSIERVPGSLMLRVSFISSDPKLAANVVNTCVEEFIAVQGEKRKSTHESATGFLRDQLQKLERNVREAEARLIEYSRQNSRLDLNSGPANVVRQRYDYLSTELARAEKDFMSVEATLAEVGKLTPGRLPVNMKTVVIESLETEVFETEQELSQLLAKFGENWPAVKQKRGEVELVRQQLRSANEAVLGEALTDARMRHAAAQTQHQMLQTAVNEQLVVVNRLNQASLDYHTLMRDVETSEQLYQGLLQRLKEASVSAGMDIGNIHVTSPAAPPEVPYRPRKALSMMLALALGLTFGVGISVVLESMDNTLADPWEVEGLGLPLLGWLPTVDKVSDGGRVQIEAGSTNGSRQFLPLPTLAKDSEKEAKGASESESLASECVRTLCSSLVLSQAGQPPQMISVSSAVPGEGKTTTAAAVGAALAEMNFPTLLVDADFRRPALAKRLGIDGTEGLSTFLAGGALKIQPTKTENLFILPAGPNPPNPLALMNSDRGKAAWKKFRESFRFVVVDSPPVLSVADSSVLASMSDGVVLVVEAAKTPSDVVQRAIRRLEQANAPILGAAVNRVNLDRPEYSRYRRYYYANYEQN